MAPTDTEIRNKVQIIHCSRRKHWIAATTVNYCKEGEVRIYGSEFNSCDDEVEWQFVMYPRLTVLKVVHASRCALSEASW